MRIFTSRYHAAKAVVESGAVPVGITLGIPKYPLKFEVAAYLRDLAPDGWMFHIEDPAEFAPAYRAKLDRLGLDAIWKMLWSLSEAHGGKDLVLLCYENVLNPGEWCHRQVFSRWWLEQTGEIVEELEARRLDDEDPVPSQGVLF